MIVPSGMVLASFLAFSASMQAQIAFQNLDFEQANLGADPQPGYVSVASALPYWTVRLGGVQQTEMIYNEQSLGATSVSLVEAADGGTDLVYGPIDGNYSVLLQGGISLSSASISQKGWIPWNAQSLLFKAEPGDIPLEVEISGQDIPYTAVGLGTPGASGQNYGFFAADVSAWAGETETLTFSALEGGDNNWLLDDIAFSPNAVPEPNTLALLLMGGLALAARRWRRNA